VTRALTLTIFLIFSEIILFMLLFPNCYTETLFERNWEKIKWAFNGIINLDFTTQENNNEPQDITTISPKIDETTAVAAAHVDICASCGFDYSPASVLSKYEFDGPEWECIRDILLFEAVAKEAKDAVDLLKSAISKKTSKEITQCYPKTKLEKMGCVDFMITYWVYFAVAVVSFLIITVIIYAACKLNKVRASVTDDSIL
jgi:hypothetical protein